MKHLKSYKLFESLGLKESEELALDILQELHDDGFDIFTEVVTLVKNDNTYLEINISRGKLNSLKMRTVGRRKVPENVFFWNEVKETIFRLISWYYSEFNFSDEKNSMKISSLGQELVTNFKSEEDFNEVRDFTAFTDLKISLRIQ